MDEKKLAEVITNSFRIGALTGYILGIISCVIIYFSFLVLI